MNTQRYEIEAWLGTDWTEDQVTELADLITAADTDDEAEWVRIVTEYDDVDATDAATPILEAAARDYDRAGQALDTARDTLRDHIRAAHALGARKADIARATGISRPTIDAWLR